MIDLRPDFLETVQRLLTEHVPEYEARVFGSRYKWTASDASDLDIALVGPGKLPWKTLARLNAALEDSSLPFRVDVLDWHTISPEFRKVIEDGYEVVQKQGMDINSAKWEKYKLEDIAVFHDSLRVPLNSREREMRKGKYPYYGASGIVDYIDSYIFDGEYVLISEDGENLRSRKTPIAFKVNGKFWVNNHAHVIKGKEPFLNDWIIYFFQNLDINPYITGAVQPKLNRENLQLIEIHLPDFNQAKKIISILSSLDDKIELNRQINTTLEAIAQAIFKEWFVEFNFPGTTGEMMESELGMIPRGWPVKKLGTICDRITKGTTPTTLGENFSEQGITFLRAECIQDNLGIDVSRSLFIATEIHENLLKRSQLLENDILITIAGTIGRMGLVPKRILPANVNQAIGIVRINPSLVPVTYAYYYLKQNRIADVLWSSITQSVQANISLMDLSNIKVIVPPRDLTNHFELLVVSMQESIEKLTEQSIALANLRNLLLPRLMKGEIDEL